MQFRYDKRINAEFCLINNKYANINLSPACVLTDIPLKSFDFNELSKHDKIIMLTTLRVEQLRDKTIYIDELLTKFIPHVYAEIPLYNYINNHKEVKVIVTNHPILENNQFTTDYEKYLLNGKNIHELRALLQNNVGTPISTRYDEFGYNNHEVYQLLQMTGAKTNIDGSTSLMNNNNPLVGIRNGKRITAYQPADYENTIYFFGTCTFFGIGAPFDKTVESYLQKKLNDNGYRYRVENESQFFAGRYQDIFYNLNRLSVKSGDIIFIYLQDLKAENVPFLDMRNVFKRPHNYGEVFADSGHLNERGYEALADTFYDVLVKHSFFKNFNHDVPKIDTISHLYGVPTPLSLSNSHVERLNYKLDSKLRQSLTEYKKMLQNNRCNIGCIVMNCNPFTLGHRHLIEYAAARVKVLYIFVVEEDKSEFPFADRIALVKQGTQDLNNVVLLPSGKFIISQLTFSGYFNKAILQNEKVDSKFDVELFAEEIAPELGINVRFAGEEPNDTVTKQYNDNMREILPRYGIKFVEIPRKSINGEIISAKKVRRLIKEGKFSEIRKFVPETTINYLMEKAIYPPPCAA